MKTISTTGRLRKEVKFEDINEEPADTTGLLEQTFMNAIPEATRRNIENASPSSMPQIKPISSNRGNQDSRVNLAKNKDYSTEKLLISLYDIHDSLVSLFEGLNHTSPLASSLSINIDKVDDCIVELGGKIEKFIPLDHVSGLSVPADATNITKVIETTKACYNSGNIEDARSDSASKSINITFMGKDDQLNVLYRALGSIVAKSSWNGNEAIDYIYTPQSGKMSVKVLEGGKWIDRSEDYKVGWELEELDLNAATEDDLLIFKKLKEKPETVVNEETVGRDNSDLSVLEEENLDFTIEEK